MIVLLKNGRRREEAKNELKIFLSDDSDSFVSWYVNVKTKFYYLSVEV